MLRYAHDCNQNQNVNIIKNTSKLTPQTLPNDLQNRHFGHPETHLGTLYEPRLDFLLKIVISGYPQGDPLGALGHQEGHKIHANTQKVTSKNYTRKQSRNNHDSRPSRTSKSMVSSRRNTRFHKYSLSPKSHQNDTQMAHEMSLKQPRRRPETLRRPLKLRGKNMT